MVSVSQTAQQVCEWLQRHSLPMIRLSDVPEDCRLPLFGLLHGNKVVDSRVYSLCLRTLQEIARQHLGTLLAKQPIVLLETSVFGKRSFTAHPPLAEHIVEQFRKLVNLAPNPVPYCLALNATALPETRLQPPEMRDFLLQIAAKQQWALGRVFAWFGAAVPAEQERTLTLQEAVDLQMTLLRYEAWSQTSYADCIEIWLQSHAASAVHAALLAKWREFSPFCGLLKPNAQMSIASWKGRAQVCFGREAGHELAEDETLRAYLSRTRCTLFLRTFRNILPFEIEENEFACFSVLFYQTFEAEFADSMSGSHLLFFSNELFNSYNTLRGKARGDCLVLARRYLLDHLALVQKLFFCADPTLQRRYHRSFSIACSILAYVHTLAVAPAEYRAVLQVSSLGALLDYIHSVQGWTLHEVVETDPCARLDQFLRRIPQDLAPVMLVRFVLEASGLRAHSKSLVEHLHFVTRVEHITGLTMNPEKVSNFLFAQFLRDEQIAWVERVPAFITTLQAYAFHNTPDLPPSVLEAISTWMVQNTVFNGFYEPEMQFLPELMQLLFHAFSIPGLGSDFSRMLHQCRPQSSTPAPGAELDDPAVQLYRNQRWAALHNGVLRELAPNLRSLCIEVVPGHKLTALWLRSCLHPDTRYFEMGLGDLSHYTVESMGRNCSDDTPIEARQGDDAVSTQIRCGIRRLVVGVDEPVVRYDAAQSRFLIQTPQGAHELSLLHYSTVLQGLHLQILQKQAITCTGLCALRLQHDVLIDCLLSWQSQACMGEGDDMLKDIQKEFYRVEFRLSQAPHTSFSMIYESAPTPLLLAWQLAMLKWRCLG